MRLEAGKSRAVTGQQRLFLRFQQLAVARLQRQFIAKGFQNFFGIRHRQLPFFICRRAQTGRELIVHHLRHAQIAPARHGL